MNTTQQNSEKRELFPEDIDRIIDLLNTLRSEISRCEDQYYKRDWEFNLDYWFDRMLLPTNLCADIVTLSNGILREMFNPWEWYRRNFSGTEHIFTVKPTSSELFVKTIGYLRSLLIPLALLYLHSMKNPENQVKSTELVLGISGLVTNVIRIRGEAKELKIWEAIDKGSWYFPRQMNVDNV